MSWNIAPKWQRANLLLKMSNPKLDSPKIFQFTTYISEHLEDKVY